MRLSCHDIPLRTETTAPEISILGEVIARWRVRATEARGRLCTRRMRRLIQHADNDGEEEEDVDDSESVYSEEEA
jgi:hypothetical protein